MAKEFQLARCATVSPRQAADAVVRRARALICADVRGCVGFDRWRRYWPERFREEVTAPTLPDCGMSRIFIFVSNSHTKALLSNVTRQLLPVLCAKARFQQAEHKTRHQPGDRARGRVCPPYKACSLVAPSAFTAAPEIRKHYKTPAPPPRKRHGSAGDALAGIWLASAPTQRLT